MAYDKVEDMIQDLQDGVAVAMLFVAAEIKDALRQHIESDVYGAYASDVYPRGHTLMKAVDTAQEVITGNMASVIYEPDGARSGTFSMVPEHIRNRYGKDPNDPLKPNPVSGDTFIRRIETGEGYDYQFKEGKGPGARPFLSNTVKELIEGKRALSAFIAGFNGYGSELKAMDVGTEITRTGDDFGGF